MHVHAERARPWSWLSAKLWLSASPTVDVAPSTTPSQTALQQILTVSGPDSDQHVPGEPVLRVAASGNASWEQLALGGDKACTQDEGPPMVEETSMVLQEVPESLAPAVDAFDAAEGLDRSCDTRGHRQTAPQAQCDLQKSISLQEAPLLESWQGGATRYFCVVCLRDYERGEAVRILPCNHRYVKIALRQ